jgi:ubiquinone/menaquinone biosynthesis C-methylase UbiE
MRTTTTAPAGTSTTPDAPALADQAPVLLTQVAGYVGFRTIALGMRAGLIDALAAAPAGLTADELAERLDLDPFYVGVWARAALASGVCDRDGDRYALAAHMATLLLDTGSPAFVGGVFDVLGQPEVFDRFEADLATGERMWWDDTSHRWIAGVAGTGRPFYTRLVPGGLSQIPGLADRLAAGGRIVDTACGAGVGLVRLAAHYPASEIVGVDGDAHSLELAAQRVAEAGLDDRVTLVHQPLEELQLDEPAALVVNNISMHECRDIDEVARRVRAALEPGGWFVVSDFPFPDTVEGLRTVPGRIMSGIQFFEAQIDDQLLPRSAYDELLTRHGFRELGSLLLTPMHAVTFGRA